MARVVYWIGLRLLVAILRRRRGVSAVLLRRGMARGDWIPAGSDYDLTMVAEDHAVDEVALASFRTIARFAAVWPVPVELSVFSHSEIQSYLDHGNFRSLEAVEGWKALYGEWSPSPRKRSRLEISLHAFSEAVDQFTNLTELLLKPSLSRAETRNFIKHFAEALICCEMAAEGKFASVPSRWKWLREKMEEDQIIPVLLRSHEMGFSPISVQDRSEAWAEVVRALHRTSQQTDLQALPAAWELTNVKEFPVGFSATLEFWSTLREEASRRGVALNAVHLHNRMVLVLADDFILGNSARSSEVMWLMRLTSLQRKEKKQAPLILSESALRLLSSTETYQQETFYSKGAHWNASTSELHGILPISNELVTLSLRARMCTLPTEMRRSRWLDPEEAMRIGKGYLLDLGNYLANSPRFSKTQESP